MASGKSTVGRRLSKRLKLDFIDIDEEVEKSAGVSISWIFDVEGESGFRSREIRMIDQLSKKKNIVLATGGGAVLSRDNRQRLKKRGVVVYLWASIKQQVMRTSRDKNRPLLQTSSLEKRIRELMEIRDPLYREVADIVVDTQRSNPKSVSRDIGERLSEVASKLPD